MELLGGPSISRLAPLVYCSFYLLVPFEQEVSMQMICPCHYIATTLPWCLRHPLRRLMSIENLLTSNTDIAIEEAEAPLVEHFQFITSTNVVNVDHT